VELQTKYFSVTENKNPFQEFGDDPVVIHTALVHRRIRCYNGIAQISTGSRNLPICSERIRITRLSAIILISTQVLDEFGSDPVVIYTTLAHRGIRCYNGIWPIPGAATCQYAANAYELLGYQQSS
jgi:hypothetical protein